MAFNDYEFRPITFQGVTFPATLMGISILEPVLGITDEDLGDWLWRLPICCGVTKRAAADRCARCAQRAADLMLENRQKILAAIRERLGPQGFDAENTYRDWLLALQRIAELSQATDSDCVWSAPSHPKDTKPVDWQRLLSALDRARAQLLETGDIDVNIEKPDDPGNV